MSELFNSVQTQRVRRNKFSLKHRVKGTLRQDYIYPLLTMPCLPGSHHRIRQKLMARLQALKSPMMQEMDITIHGFFVADRTVWNESEDFHTGGEEGTSEPVYPQLPVLDELSVNPEFYGVGSLWQHMGLPVIDNAGVNDPITVSAIPMRGHAFIWNEYYRDQTLQDKIPFSKASGIMSDPNDIMELLTMRKRAYKKDYFTSALPEPQRGEAVTIPIEGIGSVTYRNASIIRKASDGSIITAPGTLIAQGSPATKIDYSGAEPTEDVRIDNVESVQIPNVATTIEDLRTAIVTQQILELAARVGARYTEYLQGFWDVRPEDYRLQRPEFIGGSWAPMQISEVLQTMQDEGTNPLGTMGGHGIGFNRGQMKYFAKEHGWIHVVVMFTSKAAYFQGIPRFWRLFDRFDWPLPQTAVLGEQAIKVSEIYYDPALAEGTKDETFGYIPRFTEFKYMPSRIVGQFVTNLMYWHQAREFSAKPVLNGSFIESSSSDRVYAVEETEADPIMFEITFDIDSLLPLPYYGVPGVGKI